MDDLVRVWTESNWDFVAYPVKATSIFDSETIAKTIEYLIDRNMLPDQTSPVLDQCNSANLDNCPLVYELLLHLEILEPVTLNGDPFCDACIHILADGVKEWFQVMINHGVIAYHQPQAGAPFPQTQHLEWCRAITDEWRQNPHALRIWVYNQIVGMGPQVTADVQRQRVSIIPAWGRKGRKKREKKKNKAKKTRL